MTPAWLKACALEAEKGFDPNVKSYHLGWEAAMREVGDDARRYQWLRENQTITTEEMFDIKVDAAMRGEE